MIYTPSKGATLRTYDDSESDDGHKMEEAGGGDGDSIYTPRKCTTSRSPGKAKRSYLEMIVWIVSRILMIQNLMRVVKWTLWRRQVVVTAMIAMKI